MIPRSILALSLVAIAAPAVSETYVVRSAADGRQDAVGPLLAGRGVGQPFCTETHCIVVTRNSVERAALSDLVLRRIIVLEHLADARRLFFQKATYDADLEAFDRPFPGRMEVDRGSGIGQYAVIFKAYPTAEWLKEIEEAGLTPVEPLPAMGYLVYGPREPLEKLVARVSHINGILDIPAGLKRFNLDLVSPGDYDGATPTSVSAVDVADSPARRFLEEAASGKIAVAMKTGVLVTWSVRLTRAQAISASRFPEVVAVRRNTRRWAPADERSNRLVLGAWQQPGSSWPPPSPPAVDPPIPPNTLNPPYYQDQWKASFDALGMDLSHQTIGFLDTGIDRGKYDTGGAAFCPVFLQMPAGQCRLLFTTDVLENYNFPADRSLRADDYKYHGSLVASIAAGLAGATSPGRDFERYAFTQGIAPGVGVAFSKIFKECGADGAYSSYGLEYEFDDADMEKKLRYSLVEMTSDGTAGHWVLSPDRDGGWPPAEPERAVRIFNHSWHADDTAPDIFDYEETAAMIDGTARRLSFARYNFTGDPNLPSRGTAAEGALHVIAAGNYVDWVDDPNGSRPMQAPGTAKNGLTVGATQSYNTQGCEKPGCPPTLPIASNPRLVAPFSRVGYPNLRLKPDLVAPGVRLYGRRAAVTHPNACAFSAVCYVDLGENGCDLPGGGTNEYLWGWGTSFATPVVSGAAALVREWAIHRSTPISAPSSALLRAILIASAKNLVPFRQAWGSCCVAPGSCWDCGDMRPTPDQQQGWGGVSLDGLFRPYANYYFFDQGKTFTSSGEPPWTKSLTIADTSQSIELALVWTERPSGPTVSGAQNLLNDLDIKVTATGSGGVTRIWYGNNYYVDRDDVGQARTGYSLSFSPGQTPQYDRKNNVERINIKASELPPGATSLTVTVTPFSLSANGLDPEGYAGALSQDFALFAVNARE